MKLNVSQITGILLGILLGISSGDYNESNAVFTDYHSTSLDGFLAQTSVAVTTPGSSVIIDCRHTDQSINTSLHFSQSLNAPFREISYRGDMKRNGQLYMLQWLNGKNDGYYMCAREDGQGMFKIVLELFVVQEENIYNSCVLQHASENETTGSLSVCQKFLTTNPLEKEHFCETRKKLDKSAANHSDNVSEDLEKIRQAFQPLINAWTHSCNGVWMVKGCVTAAIEAGVRFVVSIYKGTLWISNKIVAVFENGLLKTTYQAVASFYGCLSQSILSGILSLQDGFVDVYYTGLWNSLCEVVSWINTRLYDFLGVAIECVFYVREIVGQISGVMDQVMSAILIMKDTVGNIITGQIHGILAGQDTIKNSVAYYSELELVEALTSIVVDSFNAASRMISWIVRNGIAFATLYQRIASRVFSYIKPHINFYIPETYTNEILHDLNGIITWFADVAIATRLATAWICHNVAMAMLKLLEIVDPTSDVTKVASTYGREEFWVATRMSLFGSALTTLRSLVVCFLGSKMVRLLVRGVVAYGDAIFSRDSMAYNIIVLLSFLCIYVGCRMRYRIERIYYKLLCRITRHIAPLWRQYSKAAAHRHHILLLTRALRAKTLSKKSISNTFEEETSVAAVLSQQQALRL